MKLEVIDYRRLRPGNLNTEEFRHLWLLLYWPVFGLLFALAERGGLVSDFTAIYSPLDDLIPFCEYFLIPYLFWFVYLTGGVIFPLFFDKEAFKKVMQFIIITYSVTIIIYFLFPNCQELRPAAFARDNIFTRFMAGFYQFDTNTNVLPSLHVIGSFAGMAGFCGSKYMNTPKWKAVNWVIVILISMSTVFLKQHSIVDVVAALPVCAGGWWLVYGRSKAAARHSHVHMSVKRKTT